MPYQEITLTSDQEAAQQAVLTWLAEAPSSYLIIGGYAGTGKTTLIASIRATLRAKFPKLKRVAFCSFTGKATAVLRQKLKDVDALRSSDSCSTIHSLIYTAVTDDTGEVLRFERNKSLPADLIIIDEGSMVNAAIWQDLRSYNVPLLVVGDHGQLPPVEGSFNLMEQPDIRLETIVRQAEGNAIIRLSRHVREGGDIPFGNFRNVRKISLQEEECLEILERTVTGSGDYLLICGTNRTRNRLNHQVRGMRGYESHEPAKGDRLICLRNNHAKLIYNGMLGTLERIDRSGEHWYDVRIRMEDGDAYEGKVLTYQFGSAKTLRSTDLQGKGIDLPESKFGDLFDFGYAVTAHKAQGSEAERAIVFEERMPFYDDELWRRWLYTAVTRAREELIVFA